MNRYETEKLERLQSLIGYLFKKASLLQQAVTHRSLVKDQAPEEQESHNENLEFLGDAVLSLVAAEELLNAYPAANEGFLSQARAAYVCEANLAKGARDLGIGDFIRVSEAMKKSGPIDLPSILADAMEGLIGAVYLDGGLEAAKELVRRIVGPLPTNIVIQRKDQKSKLQERIQAVSGMTPVYLVRSSEGPQHALCFSVDVEANGKYLGSGKGLSKKEAAQAAAASALESLAAYTPEELRLFLLEPL